MEGFLVSSYSSSGLCSDLEEEFSRVTNLFSNEIPYLYEDLILRFINIQI